MRFTSFFLLFFSYLQLGWLGGTRAFSQEVQPPGEPMPATSSHYGSEKAVESGQRRLNDTVRFSPRRFWVVTGTHALVWAGSFIALNKAWYADYPKEPFHFFNDLNEWNQMDKAGHIWTTYQLSRLSSASWRWTGISGKKAVWLGGISGLAFQSIIEIQDGFSKKWGFSCWDMAANLVGAGNYVAQELGWKEQRIQLKMGYWPYHYPDAFKLRRDELFGSGSLERMLKDYNSQTYWISINLSAFSHNKRIPRWLNASLGYSSDLMLGGVDNTWTDSEGNYHNHNDIARTRRYYLSFDVDLTRIPTRNKFLHTVLVAINAVKIPAPALEWNSGNGFRFHILHP